MYYVYLIKSIKYGEIYIGSTNNLRHRITNHNNGSEISTRRYRPWQLIYYEAFRSEKDSREREMKLKHHGNAIRELKKRIQRSLKNGGVLPRTIGNGAGFTLIELLVVVSIIGILFGVGISAYNQFNRTQMVVQSAKQVKNYIRLVQSKALTGEKDVDACGSGPDAASLEGWYINFSTKEIYGKCGATPFGIVSFDIPNNVLVTYGANPLKFKTLAGGAEIDTEAIICISGFNKKYKLRVTSSGEIKDDGLTTCQVIPANVSGLTYVSFDGSWPGVLTDGVLVQAYYESTLRAETYSSGGGNYTLQGLEPNKQYYIVATYKKDSKNYWAGGAVTTGDSGTTVTRNFYLF